MTTSCGSKAGILAHWDISEDLCALCQHHLLVLELETERRRPVPPPPVRVAS